MVVGWETIVCMKTIHVQIHVGGPHHLIVLMMRSNVTWVAMVIVGWEITACLKDIFVQFLAIIQPQVLVAIQKMLDVTMVWILMDAGLETIACQKATLVHLHV